MTVTAETPTTPAQQLDAAEAQASEEIQAIITAAVAAGLSGAAILAVLAALTGAVSRAAQTGWTIGSHIVLDAAQGRRARGGVFVSEPLPTSVEADVRAVVEDAAARIDAAIAHQRQRETSSGTPEATAAPGAESETAPGFAPSSGGAGVAPGPNASVAPGSGPASPMGGVQSPRAPVTPAPASVELARFRRRMVRLATTKIHQSASAATFSFARWLDLDLEWVTRRDGKACTVCAAMNGKRVPSGERFANPHGPGIPRRLWAGFQGLPPTHPNCRCRVIPRT